MIEEIGEILGRGVLSIIRHILWEILAQIVLFNLGRIFLLIFTFGRFPRGKQLEKYQNFIMIVGLLLPFIAWSMIAIYNNL